MPEMDLATMIF